MARVTILIPAYNAEKYIYQTIKSILSQTYVDFKLLIIDDGSIDETENIIKSFQDSRIIYSKNPQNLQITKTLNRGLEKINSEYIVRMDADDIMRKNKLKKQIEFMDKHPEIVVSGTGITKFYINNKKRRIILPSRTEEINTHFFFDSPLMHPTVIMRNKIIMQENYKYQERHVGLEDFGLWFEISKKYKLGNIRESLLEYRVSESSITQTLTRDLKKYNKSYYILFQEIFNDLGISFTEYDIENWRKFQNGTLDISNNQQVASLQKISEQIINQIIKSDNYDIKYFSKLYTKYLRKNSKEMGLNITTFINILRNDFKFIHINYIELIKYLIN